MKRRHTMLAIGSLGLVSATWVSGCVEEGILFHPGEQGTGNSLGDGDGDQNGDGDGDVGDGDGDVSSNTGGTSGMAGAPQAGGQGGGWDPGPLGDTLQIDAGDRHSCGVVDGIGYCWGDNSQGQLGQGDESDRAFPSRVSDVTDWDEIQCGAEFSCGLRGGGVYCWGSGSSGQLGSGEFSSANVPSRVDLPQPVASLSVGHDHACAILMNNALYCWGNSTEGQLAQNDPFPGAGVNSPAPLEVEGADEWKTVGAGQGHTCGIKLDGTLHCWGRNSEGHLGLGADAEGQLRTVEQVSADQDWAQIATGQGSSCAIRNDGSLWCWGENSSGQLGLSDSGPFYVPTQVTLEGPVAKVSLDTFHTCLIFEDDSARCMGRNVEGQLGDGSLDDAPEGTTPIPESDWVALSVGRFHTCGIREGAMFCTGANNEGRLGTGDRDRRQSFVPTLLP